MDKHAIIGTWTNQDGSKQWDLLEGPITLEEAKSAMPNILSKLPKETNWIEHDEFIVTWKVYKLMDKTLNP
jgi:hypothetical protein